ncbi:MAG: sensor domain-containing diguanylate cyclase, partial [Burkholderiales bacterium]
MDDAADIGFEESDDETVAAGVRRRQYRGYLIHLPVTVPAIGGLSLLGFVFFQDSEWRAWILASVLGIACVEIASLTHAYFKRSPLTYISPVDIAWVAIRSVLLGLLLLLPVALLFHQQPANTQLVIVAIVAALIGTGGFVLSPVLSAAVGWTLATGALAGIALIRANQPIFDLTLALLACYCVIVVAVSRRASMNYLVGIRAESHNARQREVVDLLLKDFEGSARDWLWDTDQAGHLRHVSVRLVEAFGQERHALEGLSLVNLLRNSFPDPSRDAAEAHDFLQLRLASRRAFRDQVVPVMVGPSVRWWALSAKPLFDADGQHTGWRGVGSDVTDARRREIEMTQLANFDALTGLANRRRFHALLGEMLSALRPTQCIDLYIVDLDNFKGINDRLGHAVGDEVLKAVAEKLLHTIQDDEALFRLGGDEYALISRWDRQAASPLVRGEALLTAIGEPFELRNHVIEIRASIGIARAPENGHTVDSLMKSADAALYAAKDAGRGRVSVYDRI